MPVRSEPVSLFLFYGFNYNQAERGCDLVSMTRTTTRPTTIQQTECRTLVEHFEPEDGPDPSEPNRDDEPEVQTQPIPVIRGYDEGLMKKFEATHAELTRMFVRILLTKRSTSWRFFAKDKDEVTIKDRHLDAIRDKVSCSAMSALVADKGNLLERFLESAAMNACDEVAGVRYVRIIPDKTTIGKSTNTHVNVFAFEVSLA